MVDCIKGTQFSSQINMTSVIILFDFLTGILEIIEVILRVQF